MRFGEEKQKEVPDQGEINPGGRTDRNKTPVLIPPKRSCAKTGK